MIKATVKNHFVSEEKEKYCFVVNQSHATMVFYNNVSKRGVDSSIIEMCSNKWMMKWNLEIVY